MGKNAEILVLKGRKQWEKEKILFTIIFSFSHNSSKGVFLRVVESLDCVVKR